MGVSPLLLSLGIFASSSGFLFGYDLGVIVATLPLLIGEQGLSDSQVEAIVGQTKIGAAIGAFSGVWLARRGPRLCFCLSYFAFVCGPLVMACFGNDGWWQVGIGRLLTGYGIGLSSVTAPMYLGDISPTAVRGAIVALYEVMLTVGVLMASLVCYVLQLSGPAAWLAHVLPNIAPWRVMVVLPMLPALLLFCTAFALPDPPSRLVELGQVDRAFELLLRLHSRKSAATGVDGAQPGAAGEAYGGGDCGGCDGALGPPSNASGRRGTSYRSSRATDEGGYGGAGRLMRFTSSSSVGSFSALPLSPSADVLRSQESAMVQSQEALDCIVAAHALASARMRPTTFSQLVSGRERRAARLMLLLAVCNQANGISTLTVYLGTVLSRQLGVQTSSASL